MPVPFLSPNPRSLADQPAPTARTRHGPKRNGHRRRARQWRHGVGAARVASMRQLRLLVFLAATTGTWACNCGSPGGGDGGPLGGGDGNFDAGASVYQHHAHASRDGLYVDPAFTHASVATLHLDPGF